MLLAIDIGNTNIVIGCIEGEKILHELRLATDLVKTSDQYWMDLKGVLALYDLRAEEIEGVIISSVVPPVLNSLRTAVMKLTGRTPMVVGPGLKTGLNIAGGNAGQVGSDLVVAAVAALREYPAPLIIIDMGTATTMMAVDASGTFLGGSICPGVKVSSEVLTTRTSQLPGISLEAPKHAKRHYARRGMHDRRYGRAYGRGARHKGDRHRNGRHFTLCASDVPDADSI